MAVPKAVITNVFMVRQLPFIEIKPDEMTTAPEYCIQINDIVALKIRNYIWTMKLVCMPIPESSMQAQPRIERIASSAADGDGAEDDDQ